MSISNSELTNNSADFGGAIYVDSSGSVSISNSELTNNNADIDSGAIYVGSGSVLTNNNSGGAIINSGSVSISNSELTVLTLAERFMLTQVVCQSPTVS